jgi:hypothetical protein
MSKVESHLLSNTNIGDMPKTDADKMKRRTIHDQVGSHLPSNKNNSFFHFVCICFWCITKKPIYFSKG